MQVIMARNVNDAYNQALWMMKLEGVPGDSRNGATRAMKGPVSTVYSKPLERMLWDTSRNANPFFHVAEAIWMLAGRNDVAFVKMFAGNMPNFSDDGVTINGAYGYRWRQHFEYDQMTYLIDLLRTQPNTRRAVLGMWDPLDDLQIADRSADVPCNTQAMFRVDDGKLNMTITNRSNDIIWGCYGANAVHMSYLLEFVALSAGLKVGSYVQFSNNWHVYERHFDLVDHVATEPDVDPYIGGLSVEPLWVGNDWAEIFSVEANAFCDSVLKDYKFIGYIMPYFNHVMIPLAKSWREYKLGALDRAIQYSTTIKDEAIRMACLMWLNRKVK